jgi:hypothetical protein
MKKIMFFLFAFSMISFNLMDSVISAFCCGPPGQRKCYASGVCCLQGTADEYWHPVSCRDFIVWVRPERMMFTLAAKTPVSLYIENKGAYTDSYVVNYEKIPNDPNIIVDLAGVTPTGNLAPGEIKKLYPRIAVLSSITNGNVTFIVNSTQEPTLQKNAALQIIESEYPVSLHEFGFFEFIEIFVLVWLIYFLILIKKD